MHLQPKMELDMLVCVWTNHMIQLFYPVKNKTKIGLKKLTYKNKYLTYTTFKNHQIWPKRILFSSRTHQGLIFKHHLVCVCWTYPHSLCCGNIPEVCAFGKLLAFVLDNTRNLQRQHRQEPKQNWIWQFPWFSQRSPKSPPSILLSYTCGEFPSCSVLL